MTNADPIKIVVVEDDDTSRQLLKVMLLQWGHRVEVFGKGRAALDMIIRQTSPLLIILDWEMPGISGIDVCTQLRNQQPVIQHYIIFLSGRTRKEDIKNGLDSGADDYILKPFDKVELHARINVGMRMIRLQNEIIERERLKGVVEMAAGVCHELNQPLMAISGLSEIVLMDTAKNKKLNENITKIVEQAQRMGQITHKLMNITRYETRPYLNRNMIDIEKASGKDE